MSSLNNATFLTNIEKASENQRNCELECFKTKNDFEKLEASLIDDKKSNYFSKIDSFFESLDKTKIVIKNERKRSYLSILYPNSHFKNVVKLAVVLLTLDLRKVALTEKEKKLLKTNIRKKILTSIVRLEMNMQQRFKRAIHNELYFTIPDIAAQFCYHVICELRPSMSSFFDESFKTKIKNTMHQLFFGFDDSSDSVHWTPADNKFNSKNLLETKTAFEVKNRELRAALSEKKEKRLQKLERQLRRIEQLSKRRIPSNNFGSVPLIQGKLKRVPSEKKLLNAILRQKQHLSAKRKETTNEVNCLHRVRFTRRHTMIGPTPAFADLFSKQMNTDNEENYVQNRRKVLQTNLSKSTVTSIKTKLQFEEAFFKRFGVELVDVGDEFFATGSLSTFCAEQEHDMRKVLQQYAKKCLAFTKELNLKEQEDEKYTAELERELQEKVIKYERAKHKFIIPSNND